MNHASKRNNNNLPDNIYIWYFTNEIRRKFGCENRGGTGSAALSLHSKNRDVFPRHTSQIMINIKTL